MRRTPRLLTIALTLGMTFAAPRAFSQGRRPGGASRGRAVHTEKGSESKTASKETEPALEQFQKMSPEERQQALQKLPADRRAKIQKQLDLYDKLTPVERAQLERFRQLPPDRQNALRKAFEKYQKSSPERQQVMRDELTNLRAMTESERAARLSSPEFKRSYSKGEQQMITDMAVALPPR